MPIDFENNDYAGVPAGGNKKEKEVKPVKQVKVDELVSYKGVSVQEELEKVNEAINEELAKESAEKEAIEEAKKKAASEARKGK